MPNVPENRKGSVPAILIAGIAGGLIASEKLGFLFAIIFTAPAILGAYLLFNSERAEIARRIGGYLRLLLFVFIIGVAIMSWYEARDPTAWYFGGNGMQIVIIALVFGFYTAGIPEIMGAWDAFRAEGREPKAAARSDPNGIGAGASAASAEKDAFSFSEDRFTERPREEPQQKHSRPKKPRSPQDSYSISDVMAEAKRWAAHVSDEKAESTAEKWERMAAKGTFDDFRKDVALAAVDLLRERLKGMANRPTPLLASDDEVLQITKQ